MRDGWTSKRAENYDTYVCMYSHTTRYAWTLISGDDDFLTVPVAPIPHRLRDRRGHKNYLNRWTL